MRYIIAYDIVNNRSRTRLADMLLGYGDRIQDSVFEAELGAADADEMMRRAERWVGPEDSLRLYPICAGCVAKIRTIGRPPAPIAAPAFRVL